MSFEKVSRLKIRFYAPGGVGGQMSADDLWDLPLTSSTGKPNLDDIARGLHAQLSENKTPTFVKTTPTKEDERTQLALDVVVRVIEVKQAENKAAAEARSKSQQKAKLMAAIERRQEEDLGNKSVEELRAMLDEI